MKPLALNKNNIEKFGSYTFVIGGLLVLLGMTGILLPNVMSLSTVVFVGGLLLTGGIFWAAHTYNYCPKSLMDWLKPILLLVTGGLMLFYPADSIAGVGLLLATYLLMDAFSSLTIAQTVYPGKGWGWMTFNGLTSALLAGLFIIGWPETSLWLVGLYVSISLLFDGWALLFIGWALHQGDSEQVQ